MQPDIKCVIDIEDESFYAGIAAKGACYRCGGLMYKLEIDRDGFLVCQGCQNGMTPCKTVEYQVRKHFDWLYNAKRH